jgi:hypothetical protein
VTDLVGYTPSPCRADKCAADLVAGDLVITEIMKNPAAVDDTTPGGEWFELYNASGGTVDLNGLDLWDDDTDATTLSSADVFAARATIVLGNNADTSTNGGVTVDIEYSGVSLANGDDEVGLGDRTAPIDHVAYTDAAFPDTSGASLSLDPGSMDVVANDDGANWCDGQTAYGVGDLGTPGAANDTCAP